MDRIGVLLPYVSGAQAQVVGLGGPQHHYALSPLAGPVPFLTVGFA